MQKTAEIRQKAKNHLRRDLSHRRRKAYEPLSDLGGDEACLQGGRRGFLKGVSSQPAAPVCHGLLPNLQGYCEIGGHFGPFQRGNHPNLSADYRHGAPTTVGTSEAGALNGIRIPLCWFAKSNSIGPFHTNILFCFEAEHKGFHGNPEIWAQKVSRGGQFLQRLQSGSHFLHRREKWLFFSCED